MSPAAVGSKLTLLMNRNAQIDELIERLVGAAPRSILLTGPAGIGKSYLAGQTIERIEAADRPTIRVAAGAAQQSLPFGALLHLLGPNEAPTDSSLELTQRMRAALRRDGDGHPIVVWLDDANLLDVQSAGLIENALMHGDAVVIATERSAASGRRDEHLLTNAFRAHADHIDVGPLGDVEVGALLVDWFGPGEHGSVRQLTTLSGGNALLLRELAGAVKAAGGWGERDGHWFVTDLDVASGSLERLVGLHLDRLEPGPWSLVQTLAAAGPLDRGVLERLDERALDMLERDRLLTGDPAWFGHPLYSEVLRANLTADDRRTMLSKLVTVVGPGDGISDVQLGGWLLELGEWIDPHFARRGAAEALNRWQNDLARRLLETIEEPTAADLVELQWAYANDGHLGAATAVADAATAATTNDDERAAAALARSELFCFQLGRRDEGLAALVDARDELIEPAQRRRVDAALSLYALVCGDVELAQSARDAALAGFGDVAGASLEGLPVESHANVLMAAGMVPAFGGRPETGRLSLEEGLAYSTEHRSESRVVRFRLVSAMADAKAGRYDAVNLTISPALEMASIAGAGPAHGAFLAIAGDLARQQGDMTEAERWFREGIRACEFLDDLAIIEAARGELGSLYAELGRRDEAEALLVDLPDDHRGDLRGEGTRARGLVRLAPATETDEFAVGMATLMIQLGHGLWAPSLLHEAARCGPAPQSAQMLAEVAEWFEGPIVHAYLDHAAGRVERDVDRLMRASGKLVDLGATLSALDVEADIIDVLKQRGDTAAAARRLITARQLLGGVADADVLPVARRLTAQESGVEVLTARQREIVDLVLAGSTSRDIGAQLFVSVRTVDNHLAAIYRKLGVAGRAELAELLG